MEKSVTSSEEHGAPREICGDRGIGNVVRELWDRAAPGLNRHELEWFARSIKNGALLLEHMADTMEKVGIHIGFCGTESANDWYGGGRAEALLHFLSESADCARALVEVGDAAYYRLLNPEQFARR